MSMETTYRQENQGVKYYRPSHMHGGGWHSREHGINPGTVRLINGVLCQAWLVNRRGWFRKPEIHWASLDPSTLRKVPITEYQGTAQ